LGGVRARKDRVRYWVEKLIVEYAIGAIAAAFACDPLGRKLRHYRWVPC
jgi:hypothetical protein